MFALANRHRGRLRDDRAPQWGARQLQRWAVIGEVAGMLLATSYKILWVGM